jgi:hypothetical protein
MTKGTPVYLCSHVFSRERAVLVVLHEDGDWQFLCGGNHAEDEVPQVVGLNHVLGVDPSLNAVMDLPEHWEATRAAVGEVWKMRLAHQKAYVCVRVFSGDRPVLLVTRPDGDWCFLCGDVHENDASQYRIVGIEHILERDPRLADTLDLQPEWEAERSALDQPWQRHPIADDE